MNEFALDDRGIVVTCPSCGQKNRLRFERLSDPVRCGKCKAQLSAPNCRMVAPEIQKGAERQAGRYLVVKVNTDALNDLGERFGIRSIPTMAVFEGGREIARTAGARPARDIEAFVENATQRVRT